MSNIPHVTREQMIEVDRLAIESGITLLSMMEKAGQSLSQQVLSLEQDIEKVYVCIGGGYNAGGGLVAARYIVEAGIRVVLIKTTEELKDVTKKQLERLIESSMEFTDKGLVDGKLSEAGAKDVVVDAIFGYGLDRKPEGRYAEVIEEINSAKNRGVKVISLDLPSGLDATTGEVYSPHVIADTTVTLALPKKGMIDMENVTGEVIVADIGIPDRIYIEAGI